LIACLLVSVGLGLLGQALARLRQQRAAIAAIGKHSGSSVRYRHEFDPTSSSPPGPAWLRSALGDDAFVEPVEAFVCDAEATQEVFDSLALLPTLETVRIDYGSLSAAELASVARMPGLRSLTIGSRLEPGSLATLASSRTLTNLNLKQYPFGIDAILGEIASLTSLQRLDLQDTAITASWLAPLIHLPKLRELNCSHCPQLDDEAIPLLAQMKQLRVLNVSSTSITPAAAQRLQQELKLDEFEH
jgi:Leucine-rich repeat (LRR) protein